MDRALRLGAQPQLPLALNKLPRYIVLRDGVVTKFPWIVVSADDGEPALWEHNAKIGRVPLRFRTRELARAAIDRLNAEAKTKGGSA